MKIIVFDFEVFKYDTLLGTIILEPGKNPEIFQTWDLSQIKEFYKENVESVWVGHNNSHYDNYILEAIIAGLDPYIVSKQIIKEDIKKKLNIQLYYYDLATWHFTSLKGIEAQRGKNISESEVDFDIDRTLYTNERLLTESYNRDDLNQTYEDLLLCKDEFQLRIDMMLEFKLGYYVLRITENQIAERVLKPQRIHSIESMPWEPRLYDNLLLKNEEVKKWYLNKDYLNKELTINLCGIDNKLARGGIHGAKEKVHYDWALYLDVSGYYNLVMMNFDLFPRTMPQESRDLYIYMYHEQLKLKESNPRKRVVYKKMLLAVYGAMLNQYTNFYDPNKGQLVTITGQIFLVDLLEKLDGKIDLIQSNTDGIMVKPLKGHTKEEILDIVESWCKRTNFVIKPKTIYDIQQRDVNNYMYRDEKGKIHTKGEAVKYYGCWDNPFVEDSYNSKTPYIIHYCIVDYYMNAIAPEDTIEKYKNELRMFQWIVKPLTYDYLTFEVDGKITKLQNVNRVFASKELGMVYKVKGNKHDKYTDLPDKVFVHNNELTPDLVNKIDYSWYIIKAWKRINEFRKKYENISLF